ncbi:glycosyltransferase [Patulibacter sp. S7RM1-6]
MLLQTVVPDYRLPVFSAVSERVPGLAVMAGEESFEDAVVTVEEAWALATKIRNRFFLSRRLLWQSLPWPEVVRAGYVLAELNPRILSTWILLLVRRLARRPTGLWGHVRGRSSSRPTRLLRRLMHRLARDVVVYTESERRALELIDSRLEVRVAPNALYRAEDMRAATDAVQRTDIVYVGRLVPAKKVDLLLRAFEIAAPRLPVETRLVIAGDGPETSRLRHLAQRIGDRVIFLGRVTAIDELTHVYARAVASVSPGYGGLAITQSLGFGVPMIVARDEPHAPEIEAAHPDNSVTVPSDDPSALADAILATVREGDRWSREAATISRDAREKYSLEALAASLATTFTSRTRP